MTSLAAKSGAENIPASAERHLNQREGAEVIHLPAATAEQVEETRGDLYDWEEYKHAVDIDCNTD